MVERYAIVSRKIVPGQQAAILVRTEEPEKCLYRLEINKSIPLAELHPSFRLYAQNGFYVFEHEQALNWVKRRVFEPEYEGIKLVLDNVGIDHYDAWEIFKKYNGRCTKDDLEAIRI